MKKGFELKINAVIKTIENKTGTVLDEEKVHNIVVDDGLQRVAQLLAGLSSTSYAYIGIGEDDTAEQATDTVLGSEAKRASATIANPSTGVVSFQNTFTFTTAESFTITEAGIFDNAVVSAGSMLNRLTFADKAVDVDTDLDITITIAVDNCP